MKSATHVSLGGPPKLIAGPPEVQEAVSDILSPSLLIKTETNPYADLNSFEEHQDTNTDIDFTRAEDFFQLETQIDVKKNHSVLKIALISPEGSFLNDLMTDYAIPTQRLAFIQQITHPQQTNFLIGTSQDNNKELIVSCQGCGEMFSCLDKFKRHILTHPDPENKKFLCQICGKRFNRADHLNRHSMLHGDIMHKCLLCGEEFDRASHLDRHRRKNHPPAGQAPSQTPPTTPRSKRSFDNPSTTSDSIGTNLHLLAAVATPEDTQDVTQQQFLQLETLEDISTEMLVNNDTSIRVEQKKKPLSEVDRPFVCQVCDRKFIRSTHLRRHTRIHTGEKPFACHICGRRYARGDYLRAHIQGHRRDRVHKCKHCNEVFHDLTRFANHCRLLHQDMEDENNGCGGKEQHQQEIRDMSYSETPISMETMNSVHLNSNSSSTVISVSPIKDSDGKRIDELTFSSVPHFSSDLLQVFNTSSASSTQADTNVILQNGTLSLPTDAENDVNIISGKVGQSQMLETLTQFFITGTGPFLGSEHHT